MRRVPEAVQSHPLITSTPSPPHQVQEAVSALKSAPPASSASAAIDPEVFELRRMPRVPVRPSLENGMQVRPQQPCHVALSHSICVRSLYLQSKRAARIEQLLRQRGIYECSIPPAAGK